MCLVAFQKIFRKIFSGVWKRRRKTQIQKNTSHNPRKNSSTTTRRDRTHAVDRNPRSRSTARSWSRLLRELAIDGAISRRRDRDRRIFLSDLAIFLDGSSSRISRPTYDMSRTRIFLSHRRSQSRSGAQPTARSHDDEIAFDASPLARARSLSLSHFPEMLWRENRSVNLFPWTKAFFFDQRISISGKAFPEVIFTQNKHSRNLQSNECVDVWMRWPGNDFKLSFDANKKKKKILDVALWGPFENNLFNWNWIFFIHRIISKVKM